MSDDRDDALREHLLEWREFKCQWEAHRIGDEKYKTGAMKEEERQRDCIKELYPLLPNYALLKSDVNNHKAFCDKHLQDTREDNQNTKTSKFELWKILLSAAMVLLGIASVIIAIKHGN